MKKILILFLILSIFSSLNYAQEFLIEDRLQQSAKVGCKTFYNEDKCVQNTYYPSYDFTDEINSYIFIFYDEQTKKPIIDDINKKELYEEIKILKAQIKIIENDTHISGKSRGERISDILIKSRELEKNLSGSDKYIQVTIDTNGKTLSAGEALPYYFNYELLSKAKINLKSDNLTVEKIYGNIFGGVIEYASTNEKIYLGYGHGFMNQIYNEDEFNNLKIEILKERNSFSNKFKRTIKWFFNLF